MLGRLQATSVGKSCGTRTLPRPRAPSSYRPPGPGTRAPDGHVSSQAGTAPGHQQIVPGSARDPGTPGYAPGSNARSRALAWFDYFFSPGTGAASSLGTKCRFWRSIFNTSAFVTLNSTRRFFARPSFVLFEATGTMGP